MWMGMGMGGRGGGWGFGGGGDVGSWSMGDVRRGDGCVM